VSFSFGCWRWRGCETALRLLPPPGKERHMVRPGLPKLIATDLDGTLVRGDDTVSAYSHDVLARVKAAGIRIVGATGRGPRLTDLVRCDIHRPRPPADRSRPPRPPQRPLPGARRRQPGARPPPPGRAAGVARRAAARSG